MEAREDNLKMKVDMHTHILPPVVPDMAAKYGSGGWVKLARRPDGRADMLRDGKVFRTVDQNCFDIGTRVREMDASGVSVQVLSTVPVMFNYAAAPGEALDLHQTLNDHISLVVKKYPKRFVGLGTVPLQAPGVAVDELRRCVRELGFPGVQIGSHVNEWNLDAPELAPFFAAAEELDCAIFVHPWDMQMDGRMKKYWLPWLVGMPTETAVAISSVIMGGVLERHPKLRMCFAHGGGCFPFLIGRIEHGFDVRPDLCATDNAVSPRNYLQRIFVDSLVHDCQALRYLVTVMGEKNVLLGTDYPFPLGERCPGELILSCPDITPLMKENLLGMNALDFLKLDQENFLPDKGAGDCVQVKKRCPSGERHVATDYALLNAMGP